MFNGKLMKYDKNEVAVFALIAISLVSLLLYSFGDGIDNNNSGNAFETEWVDPILQGDGHDHRSAADHNFSTPNMQLIGYNELTKPGNAEVQVFDSPDGGTYAYVAGWTGFHIIDVTDPYNSSVTAFYYDPNTQVLDVKYIEHGGREFLIMQNQIVDTGAAEPNVGEWSDLRDPEVSVNLVEVTDKFNPEYIGHWYDVDHPTGPHNLDTYYVCHEHDCEWYIFVANPDYDDCYANSGGLYSCGGVTIAHLNFEIPSPESGKTPSVVKVGEYEVNWENTRGGWIYIHDMTIQAWPDDTCENPFSSTYGDPRCGRTYLYGAYWEAGLRIADVTDVPRPDDITYPLNPLFNGQFWKAEEVGYWQDFADLDGDGNPDSSAYGGTNGGRACYIHYTEAYPEMVDLSHKGYEEEGPSHLTLLATEVLETTNGTGLMYLLDTTDYEAYPNGELNYFKPKLIAPWEIPWAAEHNIPGGEEWLLFSPHNLDTAHFEHSDGTWDGRIYMGSYHAGLWIIDIERWVSIGTEFNHSNFLEATVAYYVPHGKDGSPPPSSFYDFGWTPFLWAAEYDKGFVYLSCITSGLYIVQLDDDIPYTRTNF